MNQTNMKECFEMGSFQVNWGAIILLKTINSCLNLRIKKNPSHHKSQEFEKFYVFPHSILELYLSVNLSDICKSSIKCLLYFFNEGFSQRNCLKSKSKHMKTYFYNPLGLDSQSIFELQNKYQ